MASGTDEVSPELYRKRETLATLMIERNDLIEILGEIKHRKPQINSEVANVLINKYLSKIALIDKQISREAAGLLCSVCQEPLEISDLVLVCLWCGSPGHNTHLLSYIRDEGHCPACGEALKFHYKGLVRTITTDLFKTCVYALSDRIHELVIYFGDKPLVSSDDKGAQCPECERVVSPDWNFCRYCGARLEPKQQKKAESMSICPRCGRQIKSSWRFCKLCGQPI